MSKLLSKEELAEWRAKAKTPLAILLIDQLGELSRQLERANQHIEKLRAAFKEGCHCRAYSGCPQDGSLQFENPILNAFAADTKLAKEQ